MATPALAQSAIEGTWRTPAESELTITRCAAGFCGAITKIVVPDHIRAKYGEELAAIGTSYTDANNKDPALRGRPIQGLTILTLRAGRDPWSFEGEIYNPEDGNTYAGAVTVLDERRLRLKGCVLMVLCQEQEWVRTVD